MARRACTRRAIVISLQRHLLEISESVCFLRVFQVRIGGGFIRL
jgi:hypothetical protein